MTYSKTTRDFVNCMQVLIVGNSSTLHLAFYPFFPRKVPAMSLAVVNSLKFRKSADGEPNNLHPAQPELLLQLLQVFQIAFQKTHSSGFKASFDLTEQQPYSNNLRCSDKAIGTPNGNLRIPFVENFGNFPCINDLDAYDSRALLLQCLLVLVYEDEQTLSILDYLASAEAAEEDVWLRDDIRIAWITVLYASQGNPIPHVSATYQVLGLHPDKVGPAILARREALLGPAPKKQPQPVKEKAYAAKQG